MYIRSVAFYLISNGEDLNYSRMIVKALQRMPLSVALRTGMVLLLCWVVFMTFSVKGMGDYVMRNARVHGQTFMEKVYPKYYPMGQKFPVNPMPIAQPILIPEERLSSEKLARFINDDYFSTETASKYLCRGEELRAEVGKGHKSKGAAAAQPKEYAVLSMTKDLGDVDYGFQAPIAASIWKNFIGSEVIVFIITSKRGGEADWTEHPKRGLIVKELRRVGAYVVFIPSEDNHQMILGQNIRMFASLLPFVNDWDILIPSDVDIFPTNPNMFKFLPLFYCERETEYGDSVFERNSINVVVYNAFCCGKFDLLNRITGTTDHVANMYPICNIVMPSLEWKSIYLQRAVEYMGNREVDTASLAFEEAMGEAVLKNLEKHYTREEINTPYEKPDGLFYSDQHSISQAIEHNLEDFKKMTLRLPRNTLRERIDRLFWPRDAKCEDFLSMHDAHNFQNAAVDDAQWESDVTLLKCMSKGHDAFDYSEIESLIEYRQEFKDVSSHFKHK